MRVDWENVAILTLAALFIVVSWGLVAGVAVAVVWWVVS